MGVPPMNHGQDARATLAAKGFCKSLLDQDALEVGVGIVLCTVVGVLRVGLLRREPFEPAFKIAVKPRLVVIDEDAA
jgi:hypothetical protein